MEPSDTQRELSFGEKAVGLTFNPSGDPSVQSVKELYANVIDLCNDIRNDSYDPGSEKGKLFELAIRAAQDAQMWAVKAITWKD